MHRKGPLRHFLQGFNAQALHCSNDSLGIRVATVRRRLTDRVVYQLGLHGGRKGVCLVPVPAMLVLYMF